MMMVEDHDLMKVQQRLSKLERDMQTLALSFARHAEDMATALKNIQETLQKLPVFQMIQSAPVREKYTPDMFLKGRKKLGGE
jgi:DNA repair exonuclease SbcCD ATPase subunit